jgi:DNA-binding transcriptional ArsR family regulator
MCHGEGERVHAGGVDSSQFSVNGLDKWSGIVEHNVKPDQWMIVTRHHDDTGDTRHVLDYELDDIVTASTNAQMKAVANDTRTDILNLLLEKAATVSQLADALDKPKGTVGYHAKVLEDAGMIRVVRTNKVRAMTEKYYGRTGRTIHFSGPTQSDDALWFVHEALKPIVVDDEHALPMFTSRVARIPVERAIEFSERIMEVAQEFIELPREGETMYGFLGGIYPTDLPAFGDEGTPDE